ncbi:MAG: hypothetical protein V4651_04490 [Bacteroidota bacterium]
MMLLLFLSGYFYLEKMTQMDSAFVTIAVVNKAGFVIPHYRFPIVFTQVLPVVLIWLSAPLKWVVFSYSVNFYLLYALCYGIAVFKYKQPSIALLIPLVCAMNSGEVFFIQTEILHGLVFAVLFLAWLEYHAQNTMTRPDQLTGIFFAITAMLFHPIVNVLLFFILVYHVIKNKKRFTTFHYTIAFIAFAWLLVKAYFLPDNGYEDQFYSQQKTVLETLSSPMKSYVIVWYMRHATGLYLLTNILFLLAILVNSYLKRWMLLTVLLLSSVGYVLLMSVLFKGDSNIMMERIFLGLALIIGLAAIDCLGSIRLPQWSGTSLLIVIFGIGFANILMAAPRQIRHLNISKELAQKLQQHQGHKFYTTIADVPYANEYVMWPLASEQLIVSSIFYPDAVKTIYLFTNQDEAKSVLSEKDMHDHKILVASFYLKIEDSVFNKKYFTLLPEPYQYIQPYQ